jgi:hypothetical protein
VATAPLAKKELMAENICCPLFGVVPCADTDEHQHLLCKALSRIEANPMITNQHAVDYCINDEDSFKRCPYYPKYG